LRCWALAEALDYCIDMGFYDATVDLGKRGRAVTDWQRQPDLYSEKGVECLVQLPSLPEPRWAGNMP
jgi:hypothetical protein